VADVHAVSIKRL